MIIKTWKLEYRGILMRYNQRYEVLKRILQGKIVSKK